MKLNEAVSQRLQELLKERGMTQYQLSMKSGVPKSTIGNVVNCMYDSVKLRIIHELCQGMNLNISEFFNSPMFEEENLEPLGCRCEPAAFLYVSYIGSASIQSIIPYTFAARVQRQTVRSRTLAKSMLLLRGA